MNTSLRRGRRFRIRRCYEWEWKVAKQARARSNVWCQQCSLLRLPVPQAERMVQLAAVQTYRRTTRTFSALAASTTINVGWRDERGAWHRVLGSIGLLALVVPAVGVHGVVALRHE